MTSTKAVQFAAPGKGGIFTCEESRTYFTHGKAEIAKSFLFDALQYFHGKTDVPADFYVKPSRRDRNSFTEWMVTESPTLNPPGLKAIEACFVAGILCGIVGVKCSKQGPHDKVFLSFP